MHVSLAMKVFNMTIVRAFPGIVYIYIHILVSLLVYMNYVHERVVHFAFTLVVLNTSNCPR